MDYQSTCNYNSGNYLNQSYQSRQSSWYQKIVKPLISFTFSVILALSISQISEKYSSNNNLNAMKTDLNKLRSNLNILGNNLNSLSNEVKVVMESNSEIENNFKEIKCRLRNLSDTILKLRNEVYEESISLDSVKEIVKSELETYDADKTGKTDFALESSGGSIISTRNTETYFVGVPTMSIFGIPICKQQNIPRIIIQAGVQPGECWAFKGNKGTVVIKLSGNVLISGVSLEHIPQSISPNGDITSAPKDFSIRGLDSDSDERGFLLGKYTYNSFGPAVQYFDVQNVPRIPYEMIELNILSNNGNYNYTCVYRFRVHGALAQQ